MNNLPLIAIVGGPDVDARAPLVRQMRDSFRFLVLGSDSAAESAFADSGAEFRAYPLSRRVAPFSDLRTMRALKAEFVRSRPDLVHAFDTKPGVFACLAARNAGVPAVTATVTGLGSLYSADGPKTRLLRAIYERMQRAACGAADITVFQNHDDERQLLDARVARRGKTAVVLGSGVDTEAFDPDRIDATEGDRVRDELGIAKDAVVVTMIGRMLRTKGANEFAALARRAKECGPRVRFLAVGPDDRDSLDRLTNQELDNLRAAAICPGPRKDIAALLAASDVFVLPSVCREGIPRVLLEAAAMGLPLITTDSPGCNEACIDGVNGFLVRVGDFEALARATMQLATDVELRRSMGRASRDLATRRFSLRVVASQMAQLWSNAIEAGRATQSSRNGAMSASNHASR